MQMCANYSFWLCYFRYESRREKLLNTIGEFLLQQRKLQVFVMNSAQV